MSDVTGDGQGPCECQFFSFQLDQEAAEVPCCPHTLWLHTIPRKVTSMLGSGMGPWTLRSGPARLQTSWVLLSLPVVSPLSPPRTASCCWVTGDPKWKYSLSFQATSVLCRPSGARPWWYEAAGRELLSLVERLELFPPLALRRVGGRTNMGYPDHTLGTG